MKIKLHFSRINMQRKLSKVWTAHTSKVCNQTETILIQHNGIVIGKTVYKPEASQPKAYIEFYGEVVYKDGKVILNV